MHVTSIKALMFELLTYNFVSLMSNSPVNKNIEEEENFEVSFDVVPGDGLKEETVMFNNPKEKPLSRLRKLKRLISRRKHELVRSKKSSNASEGGDYDYNELKREYYGEVYEVEKEGLAYNYTDHKKGEETVGDSIHSIANFKEPVNCSQEESKNIGIQAINCLWQDYWRADGPGMKNRLLKRATILAAIWIIIYFLVAISLWCTKGWCCCCCRCQLCRPRLVVMSAKKFLYENKPGEIAHSDGETEYYEPTQYEKEAYRSLQYTIKTF